MQPRLTLLILGVDDVERAVRCYRDGLGLKTEGIVGTEFEQGCPSRKPEVVEILDNLDWCDHL